MNSKAQESKDRYLKEKVETFVIRVPIGKKTNIQEFAKNQGKSLNAYIVELINEDMENKQSAISV